MKQKYPHFNEPWTKEDIDTLTEMVIGKSTQKEIAEKLGRSAKSVKLKMMDLGLYQKRKKRIDDNQVWWVDHLYMEEFGIQYMSQFTGLSEYDVLMCLLRLGVASKEPPKRIEYNEDMEDVAAAEQQEGDV